MVLSPNDHTSTPGSSDDRTRPRIRTTHACNPCRSRKVKCDGSRPCKKCIGSRQLRECVYGLYRSEPPMRVSKTPVARSLAPKPKINSVDLDVETQDGDTSSAAAATALDDPVANKKQQELRAGIGAFNSNTDAYQFYGPSSHFSFVQRLYQRIRRQSHQPLMLEVQPRVPEGLRQWGIERQIFNHGDDGGQHRQSMLEGNCLPKELGETFIAAYFNLMHHQAPVLIEREVMKTYEDLWGPPQRLQAGNTKTTKERSVLYMVLAIGARLVYRSDWKTDSWADYFYERAGSLTEVFEETSLTGTHLLLLRAIYAMQIGRSNWVYLYLGHAARCAMALGLHRAQVTTGNSVFMTRLRLTIWTIYYMERMIAMFSGRPTCFVDEHIDTSFPDDLPEGSDSRPTQYAYVRAMAQLGKITDRIMTGNYSSKTAKRVSELSAVNQINNECIADLRSLLETLPCFLHFYDHHSPVKEQWQEVQRLCFGVSYHIARTLIFRPALVYVTFFDSLALAQESIGDRIDVKHSMEMAVVSAKELIDLAHDTLFRRCPAMKRDGNIAFFIVSACLTLLFEVLDAETTPAHATEVFHVVDKGLQCLDLVDHIGSTTGRAISLDVMKVAKDALFSTEAETRLGSNLVENFSWLNDDFIEMPPDFATGSWLYNAMGMSDLNATNPANAHEFTHDPTLAGVTDQSQMALDMMGEGLRFAGSTVDATHF